MVSRVLESLGSPCICTSFTLCCRDHLIVGRKNRSKAQVSRTIINSKDHSCRGWTMGVYWAAFPTGARGSTASSPWKRPFLSIFKHCLFLQHNQSAHFYINGNGPIVAGTNVCFIMLPVHISCTRFPVDVVERKCWGFQKEVCRSGRELSIKLARIFGIENNLAAMRKSR